MRENVGSMGLILKHAFFNLTTLAFFGAHYKYITKRSALIKPLLLPMTEKKGVHCQIKKIHYIMALVGKFAN